MFFSNWYRRGPLHSQHRRRSGTCRRTVRPCLEPLEDRLAPAAGLTLDAHGILLIEGTSRADQARVTTQGDRLHVALSGKRSLQRTFALKEIKLIVFIGGDGNDLFHNATALPSVAFGGAGRDVLVGGAATDLLFGRSGRDLLSGEGGKDLLAGQAGSDTAMGGLGDDVLVGGLGRDLLLGQEGVDLLLGNTQRDTLLPGRAAPPTLPPQPPPLPPPLPPSDNQAPVIAITEPESGLLTADNVAVAGRVTDDAAGVALLEAQLDAGTFFPVAFDASGNFRFDTTLPLDGSADGAHTVGLRATDQAGNTSGLAAVTFTLDTSLLPDPADVAPPLDRSVATNVATSTAFLYSGSNPIQTGVAPDTIVARRAAVIRGEVTDRAGNPLSDATITILNHPELGQTRTRADGMFDLAVNGGGPLTVKYARDGFLGVQRQVQVPWQDFVFAPDVVLVPLDPEVTTIDLAAAAPIQVARGSAVTDADGTRRATLLFPQGTTAEMVLPDGSRQALTTLTVRATEYTIGDNGPEAMPAELPPASGYTYAVELSADEALAAGATQVSFSAPVPFYVENFLGFPVGGAVPAGFYDRQAGQWIASDNGRVIAVVAESGGLAEVDIDGDGTVDDAAALAGLGITDAEREQLAVLYDPGAEVWRVPIPHFSPWDCNWPYGPPLDAIPPELLQRLKDRYPDHPCFQEGSIVECQTQVVGERLPVAGTPFTLNYRSSRVPGRTAERTLEIPLIGPTVPASLRKILLEIEVAGQRHTRSFAPEPDQSFTFTWDGKDAFGRVVQGAQPITVRVGYVYGAVYREPGASASSFARFGASTRITTNRGRQEITLWQQFVDSTIGPWDARGLGLGGWSLDVHHAYSPEGRVLYLGSGEQRSAEDVNALIISAVKAQPKFLLSNPRGVAVGPDGSVYIADSGNNVIRRVGPDGASTIVAGTFGAGFSGDGGPATGAELNFPEGLALGPDGSVYLVDSDNHRIRRVGPDGVITTVAGNGDVIISGDGGPATEAGMFPDGIAVGPDGSLYIADSFNHRIRRVGPDGIITTLAGTGISGFGSGGFSGDGGPAAEAELNFPEDVAVGPDGSVYIADLRNHRVRRIGPDGVITTVAGTGESSTGGFDPVGTGDGGPATSARIDSPHGLDVAPDGSIYIYQDRLVRRVGPNGIITTVAGNEDSAPLLNADGIPATQVGIFGSSGDVAVGPDSTLYIAEEIFKLRSVSPSLPGFTTGDMVVPSEDGSALYHFRDGRHLRTLHTLTGAVLYEFGYDDDGGLASVTDGDGLVTTIERDAEGNPVAIVGPFGQRTELTLDANGFLSAIRNPAGEIHAFTYTDGGLLTSRTDPRGNTWKYTYGEQGRLIGTEDPVGGALTLARTRQDNGHTVTVTTALGLTTTYVMEALPDGSLRRATTDPTGATTEMVQGTDGSRTLTYADGSTITAILGPDPRWGMASPITRSLTFTSPAGGVTTLTATRSVELEEDPDNPLSPLIEQTDVVVLNGQTYTSVYDAATDRVTTTSPEGRETSQAIDDQGRLVELRIDAAAEPLRFTYDERGLLVGVTQGDQAMTYTYDAAGNVSSRTDAAGNQDTYAYDAVGRLSEATTPRGNTVGFQYDANGNRTGLVLPSGAVHTFAIDAGDRYAGYTAPGGDVLTRTFNADGAWTGTTQPDGRAITVAYDGAGRIAGMSYPEANTSFVFEGNDHHLTRLSRTPTDGDTGQDIAFAYADGLNTELAFSGASNGAYTFRYDDRRLLAGLQLNDRPEVAVTRDADGRVVGVGPFTLSREGTGGPMASLGDGTAEVTYTYDTQARIDTRSHTVAGTGVYSVELDFDNTALLSEKVETVNGVSHTYLYDYDADGQLVEVQRDGVVVESYAYDANANRTATLTTTATYDGRDHIVAQGTVSYTFDANGFLEQRGSDAFTYGSRGELLQVALADGTEVSYAYDALGRRVSRTDASGTTQYLYSGAAGPYRVTAAIDPDGVTSELLYDETGRLFAVRQEDAWLYVATDQVGTPRVVTDAAGNVLETLEYDSFGVKIADSNASFALPVGFGGGLEDTATGLVRFGFRDYEPESGRWTVRDPVGFDGGQINLYAYVGNNPVNLVDPSGLFCIGGSLYALFGGGGELCIDGDGVSACAEVGLGLGGGVDVGLLGETKPTGTAVGAELSASIPGGGIKFGLELQDCGVFVDTSDCSIGPGISCIGLISGEGKFTIGVEGSEIEELVPDYDLGKRQKVNTAVKVGGKVYAKACAGLDW